MDFQKQILSIDDRNQSLMDFVTEDCQKENALDIEIHADFDSKGTIESSYQSVSDPDDFIVLERKKVAELLTSS